MAPRRPGVPHVIAYWWKSPSIARWAASISSWIRFGGNVSRTRVRVIVTTLLSSSRDGGHDRDRVAVLQRRLAAVHEPDVFLVHVDVDEAPQLPALVHQPLLQTGKLALEIGHDVVHGCPLGRDLGVALRHLAQGGGNANRHRHRRLLIFRSPRTVGPQPHDVLRLALPHTSLASNGGAPAP